MDKPIRILHVLQRMEAAGSQNLLMNLYRNIDRNKVQFDFLVHYKEKQFFDDEIEKMGGKIYRLSVREDYNFIKYYRELMAFFKEHKEYKIVHGHMHSLGAVYLYCAKKNGVPVRIAHSHSNSSSNDAKKIIKECMIHFYKKSANYLFACSDAAGKYMFGNSKFKVINNAIDSNKFIFDFELRNKKRAELGLQDKFVIGHVGRFEIPKNHKFLVDIFNDYKRNVNKDAILLLVGVGSLEEKIKDKVKKLNLEDSVYFLKNRRDVSELYQAMDVFVFPSLYEGLGIVAVEAQAAGIPCVCTDSLPSEVKMSSLFYSAPLSSNTDEWVKQINTAIKDENKYKDMSNVIKESGYDIKTLAKNMEEFYLSKYA